MGWFSKKQKTMPEPEQLRSDFCTLWDTTEIGPLHSLEWFSGGPPAPIDGARDGLCLTRGRGRGSGGDVWSVQSYLKDASFQIKCIRASVVNPNELHWGNSITPAVVWLKIQNRIYARLSLGALLQPGGYDLGFPLAINAGELFRAKGTKEYGAVGLLPVYLRLELHGMLFWKQSE